ncbi:MAG: hypothetical protein WAX22_02765 [Lactococcus hircilactis]|uniref:hypothetical protein n=1 Tax=Lactococcus hircilactis TaxID=1494462 RepID=UPI003BE072B6
MNNKQKAFILGTGFVCGVILTVILLTLFPLNTKANNSQIVSSQVISKNKKEISSLKQQLQEAGQTLQNVKNGKETQSLTTLQNDATKLFDTYYNYDQAKMTNKQRQAAVSGLISEEVAVQLFPLSADTQSSDYGAIQSQLNGVKIYTQPQTGTTISALVDCDYSVKAGTMSSEVPHYEFQITYDISSQKIVAVNELGRVTK